MCWVGDGVDVTPVGHKDMEDPCWTKNPVKLVHEAKEICDMFQNMDSKYMVERIITKGKRCLKVCNNIDTWICYTINTASRWNLLLAAAANIGHGQLLVWERKEIPYCI